VRVEDLCPNCNVRHPSKEHIAALVPHGNTESTVTPVGRGHWKEVSYFFKCPECGAVWENLVESGAGGHGNFWNRIDPPS